MNKWIRACIILLIAVVIGMLYVVTPTPSVEAPSTARATISATLSIENHGTDVHDIAQGTSALELLRTQVAQKNLTLKERKYEGLGTFIEQIGDMQNGSAGKYWHYYINNTLAPVSADSYVIMHNDLIEWRFHEPDMNL